MSTQRTEDESLPVEAPQGLLRQYGFTLLAVGSAIASVIQIVTSGRPTTQGWLITAAHHGNVVHWYAFEGFSRGRDQAFQFREVLVHLTRAREVGHEQVTAVELTTAAAPRALITFTPPHERVLWEVRYRCPGYWDKLRQAGGQRFEWVPPPVGPGETKGRRSVVRAVTFVFRVPATLGTLEAFDLPRGASFRRAATDAHGSTYRIDIRDISALLGPPATAIDPIRWYLELKSADAP